MVRREAVVAELLEHLEVDGIDSGWIASTLLHHHRSAGAGDPSPRSLRREARELAAELVAGGLIVPGDIATGTFVAWGLAPRRAARRVRRRWPRLRAGAWARAIWFDSATAGEPRRQDSEGTRS